MVATNKLKVNWTTKATQSLKNHYQRIKKKSPQSADRVRKEIFKATNELPIHPRKYQVDEYYPKGSGEIRRFFKWSFRVVYEVQENTINILNVIHTSQEPFRE